MTDAIPPVLNVLATHRPVGTAHHIPRLGKPYTTIHCSCQPHDAAFFTTDQYTAHLHAAILEAIGPAGEVRTVREYTVRDPEGHVWDVYTTPTIGNLTEANAVRESNGLPVWEIVTRTRTTRYGVTTTPWVAVACCDLHNRNCEPPSELCCERCTEATHAGHADGSVCIAPDLSPPHITRVDKYTIEINGTRVRAGEDQERRIRTMTPRQIAGFLNIMGGGTNAGCC